MTIKIEKDGWIVSGATQEELEMAIAAVQAALSKIRPNGEIVQPPRRGRPPKQHGTTVASEQQVKTMQNGLKFFETLVGSPKQTAPFKRIQEVFQLKHPQGVGAYAQIANRCVEMLGMEKHEVFEQVDIGDGTKGWEAGLDVDKAIDELKRRIAQAKQSVP